MQGIRIPRFVDFHFPNSSLIEEVHTHGRARESLSLATSQRCPCSRGKSSVDPRLTVSYYTQTILRGFCEALPADRLLLGNTFDLDEVLAKEKFQRTYIEPSTQAKLTYRSSLSILAHFVGSLVSKPYSLALLLTKSHSRTTMKAICKPSTSCRLRTNSMFVRSSSPRYPQSAQSLGGLLLVKPLQNAQLLLKHAFDSGKVSTWTAICYQSSISSCQR